MQKEEDYYALVKYMGRVKYFHVTASYTGDLSDFEVRLSYIDFNPNREHEHVWIKKSNEKILNKFHIGSEEYDYFNKLLSNFEDNMNDIRVKYNMPLPTLYYVNQCYKKAYKETEKPIGINF